MHPVSVFANDPGSEIEKVQADLHGRWREATRAVMVLLSQHGIAALLKRPGQWALPRIRRYLGRPQVSARTLYRRVRLVAIWRRPKLTVRGDPESTTTWSPRSWPGR